MKYVRTKEKEKLQNNLERKIEVEIDEENNR